VYRPEDFEDMVAVQLSRANPEPFLGMGSEAAKIDLWLWRASWQRPTPPDAALDDYPFDSPGYQPLLKDKSRVLPDLLTARAAGNLNAAPDGTRTGSHLAAKGFGTVTFAPKASQVVTARSAWTDGHWSVVLRRPLKVGDDAGLSLEPGGRCSAAFA